MSTQHIKLVEVGPRDGLQNEPEFVLTKVKLEYIKKLVEAGCHTIEVTSFVSPKHIPQFKDSTEVLTALARYKQVHFPVLVPNQQGLEAAIAAGAQHVAFFTAASETFCQKNIGCTVTESLERYRKLAQTAKAKGMTVRGYISCVIDCLDDGPTPVSHVIEIAETLFDMGCEEVSLGDTTGQGAAGTWRALLVPAKDYLPITQLAMHCHDTYGQALANLYTGLDHGIHIFDTATGGLGGCPTLSHAGGNVATEEALYLFDSLGLETGIDSAGIHEATQFIHEHLGHPPRSKLALSLAQ